MSHSSFAIGLFDSGIGGLTVLQELKNQLPLEQFIYFGDTARVPYGNKSQETIIRYSIENTITLIEKNIKLLVVACNTASALALPKLRQLFNLPIIGVIEPGAKQAASTTKNQRIAVLGTRGTIQSGAYQQAIQQLLPQAMILPIECPLFVPLVEEQLLDHPATTLLIKEYLQPIKNQSIDTVLLGCTHYPLLEQAIQKELGEAIRIVNSASCCAEEVKKILKLNNLISSHYQGPHAYYTSDAPQQFKQLGKKLFNCNFESVELLIPHRLNH
jgi:glutamate racemase